MMSVLSLESCGYINSKNYDKHYIRCNPVILDHDKIRNSSHHVINSAMTESVYIIHEDVFPFYYGFNGSLLFLLCLHVYWFGLMLRMLYRVVSGKEKGIVDSREAKKRRKEEEKLDQEKRQNQKKKN